MQIFKLHVKVLKCTIIKIKLLMILLMHLNMFGMLKSTSLETIFTPNKNLHLSLLT